MRTKFFEWKDMGLSSYKHQRERVHSADMYLMRKVLENKQNAVILIPPPGYYDQLGVLAIWQSLVITDGYVNKIERIGLNSLNSQKGNVAMFFYSAHLVEKRLPPLNFCLAGGCQCLNFAADSVHYYEVTK